MAFDYSTNHGEGMLSGRFFAFILFLVFGGATAYMYLYLGWVHLPSVLAPLLTGLIAFVSLLASIGEGAADIFDPFD